MARSLDQAMSELDRYYSGSKNIIQTQLNGLPGETDAAIAQADAKLADANDSILGAARRRGLGFSGIPVGEQARYAATEYAPAIANLKSSQNAKQLSLMETLNGLGRDQRSAAQGLVEGDLGREFQQRQFEEQIRQFNEQMAEQRRQAAAAQANIGAYLGGGAAQGGAAPGAARIARGQDGGYGFFDGAGRPINALQYAQLTGTGYRQLLSQMASTGDKNAQLALNYVGDDGKFGSAPEQYKGALGALGASGSYVPQVVQKLSSPVALTLTKGAKQITLPSVFNGGY